MKRIGGKKAAKLAEEHPGITLSSWVELNYKHVTLDRTVRDGSKTITVPQHNVELTIALLSTDNVADWAKVAFHWAPAGTIVDKVSASFYESNVLLLRQLLTKKLITEPNNRMAQRYLQVLERRDSERWAQRKQAMAIKASATPDGGSGDGGEKKIVFDFEIVQ